MTFPRTEDVPMLAGQLALIVAALFAGAAVYVSAVEQPARLSLDDRALLTQWKPTYKRGTAVQAPLAIIGFLLGLTAWCRPATGHGCSAPRSSLPTGLTRFLASCRRTELPPVTGKISDDAYHAW